MRGFDFFLGTMFGTFVTPWLVRALGPFTTRMAGMIDRAFGYK